MATKKSPSKEEFLEQLKKNGIKSLEDLINAIMPETDETGGYVFGIISEENQDALQSLRFQFKQWWNWAEENTSKPIQKWNDAAEEQNW